MSTQKFVDFSTNIVFHYLPSYFSTALTLSAEYGKLDVVKFLVLEKKASLELTDNDGE